MKGSCFKIFLIVLCFPLFCFAQNLNQGNIKKHIVFLSSDELEGRATASKAEKIAAKYIASEFEFIGLQPISNEFMQEFVFKRADPHGNISPATKEEKSQNVIGFLDNQAKYTVIIGAHYDHLGLGHDHNSLEANSEGQIHNGADDNASGVAGVLELAKVLSENKVKEAYNYLFICFSGEELGLIGSKKFCENPLIDLKTVNYMINLDMIGRLNEKNKMMVGGVGTSSQFVPTIEKLSAFNLVIKQDSSGIGPSDHTSFYLKDIPVLFFFTGQHEDYHKPSDDANKINYLGETKVLEYIHQIILLLDKEPKQVFQETKNKQENTPSFKVTLGIMPNYVYEGKGVQVDGVTDGKPACRAGLRKEDIILQLGDVPISNMQEYMKALSTFEKGESTKVKVKRGEEELWLDVTFQ